jgi:hypothetical protein
MPVSAAEHRLILDNLTRMAEADILRMWRAAELQTDLEFAAYVTQAYPQIVDPYHQMAAQTAATIFEEDFPAQASTAVVVVADPLPEEQLVKSAQWALSAYGTEAIDRLAGTAQRAIYDGDRETTVVNAESRGMRWVRVARPDACPFCKLLSARTASGDYYSGDGVQQKKGIDPDTGKPYAAGIKTTAVYGRGTRRGSKRAAGSEYHDNCHCVAKAIPARTDALDYLSRTEPQAAEMAEQFDDEYTALKKAAANKGEYWDTKKVLSEWRKADKAR